MDFITRNGNNIDLLKFAEKNRQITSIDLHGDCNGIGNSEHNPNRTTEFRSKGAGYHKINAT